jgi:hypothetical protein
MRVFVSSLRATLNLTQSDKTRRRAYPMGASSLRVFPSHVVDQFSQPADGKFRFGSLPARIYTESRGSLLSLSVGRLSRLRSTQCGIFVVRVSSSSCFECSPTQVQSAQSESRKMKSFS